MNGSNDLDGRRNKSNRNLLSFTSASDERLDSLKSSILKFLKDWHHDVLNREGRYSNDDRERMMTTRQAYESLHITIFGLCGAVVYLLKLEKCGRKFVNGPVFSPDPTEQHFSKQRGRCGGSRNPNVAQFQQAQVVTALQRGLGFKKRKGNSSE